MIHQIKFLFFFFFTFFLAFFLWANTFLSRPTWVKKFLPDLLFLYCLKDFCNLDFILFVVLHVVVVFFISRCRCRCCFCNFWKLLLLFYLLLVLFLKLFWFGCEFALENILNKFFSLVDHASMHYCSCCCCSILFLRFAMMIWHLLLFYACERLLFDNIYAIQRLMVTVTFQIIITATHVVSIKVIYIYFGCLYVHVYVVIWKRVPVEFIFILPSVREKMAQRDERLDYKCHDLLEFHPTHIHTHAYMHIVNANHSHARIFALQASISSLSNNSVRVQVHDSVCLIASRMLFI